MLTPEQVARLEAHLVTLARREQEDRAAGRTVEADHLLRDAEYARKLLNGEVDPGQPMRGGRVRDG